MLSFLTVLAAASLGGGAAILLLTALSPFLARRFAPKVRRTAWLVLAYALFFVPFQFPLFLQITSPLPHAVTLTTPRVLVESEYRPEDAYREDNEYAQTHYNYGGAGIRASRHYLHFRGNDGRELDIEDNYFQRTVTENGVETRTVHWTTLVFLAWLLGAAVHTGAVWGSYHCFRRRALRWAVPAGEGDLDALARQREAVDCRKAPALYRCSLVRTPLLMGVREPVILLPEDLPEEALGPSLAHELTHLRESHLSDKVFFMLARTVHWFNPLVWWMVRRAGQDLELCCDYALTQGRDEAARRTYGQAILDQMTAGKREGASLTTGFSGSKEEVFRRFRAIMDRSPKGRGRAAAVLLACAVLLSQTLVSCQSEVRTGLDGELLVRGTLNGDLTAAICQNPEWTDPSEEEQTYPLAGDAELLYYPYEDSEQTCALNPATIEYSIRQSQFGRDMELTFNEAGEVTRLVLRGGVSLDLAAAGLDFTGFTGAVYAPGTQVTLDPGGTVTVNPCTELNYDEDDARYTLSLAGGADIPLALRSVLSPLSSAARPALCALALKDGQVTAIREYPDYPELTLYRDGQPYPLSVGNPDFLPYASGHLFGVEPEIEVHADWEPVYSEGSYWATLSWNGLSAVCYYSGAEGVYYPYQIDAARADLSTRRGVRVGDSREKVLDAYPELESAEGHSFGEIETKGQDVLWYNVDGSDLAPEALLFFFDGDTLSRMVLHFTFD